LDVTGNVGLSEPITIGYTVPILNNQLGYYTRSFFTQDLVLNPSAAALSLAPIGPLVPGLYLATINLLVQSDYTPFFRRIQPIGRTTPFINGTVYTGENIVYNTAGLFLEGHVASAYLSNDVINFQASGFIHLKATDTLQGTTVSYFSVSLYAAVSNFKVKSYDFSVVRVG
jgi:hypothetical protein